MIDVHADIRELKRFATAQSGKHVIALASQVLLYREGSQSRPDDPSKRFTCMAHNQDSRLQQLLDEEGLPAAAAQAKLTTMGQLDDLITQRNKQQHYSSISALDEAVQDALDNYVTAAVRQQQPAAVWVLERYGRIKEVFKL